MKEIHSNISIIGGGLIGVSIAYSLSLLGLKITIIEKNPPFNFKKYDDTRTTAISEGTKNFLVKIGIWKDIKEFVQPIKKIKVIDRNILNKLEFDNLRRNSNLGYIVKNKHILNCFYKKIRLRKNIKILNNASLINLENNSDKAILYLKNFKIISELNIAADGKKSFVKKILKTPFFTKNYNKSAIVINFTHSADHKAVAYEFFYKNGPLAILPMKKFNNQFRSSIVWTNNKYYTEELLKMSDEMLCNLINKFTHLSVGKVKNIITRQLFPINAHLNTKFYAERLIYVGDAAHSFHPIAGQGWNLGMRDVENLNKLVIKYQSLGIGLGGKIFCKEYQRDNFYNAYRLYQLTDKLDSIFKLQNPVISIGRALGLNYLQKNKKFNNVISDFAMGVN